MTALYKAAAALACGASLVALAQADNPIARRGANNVRLLDGYWNGANLERRSNCTAAQNNGTRGTYAEYFVSTDPVAGGFYISETAVTGLRCEYTGSLALAAAGWRTAGRYTCSDGKAGDFTSQYLTITPNEMQVRLNIKLTGSETCDIDSILGGSRF